VSEPDAPVIVGMLDVYEAVFTVAGVVFKFVAHTTDGPVIVGTGGIGRIVTFSVVVAKHEPAGSTSATSSRTVTDAAVVFGHTGAVHVTRNEFGAVCTPVPPISDHVYVLPVTSGVV
jgi:hypothetical protein